MFVCNTFDLLQYAIDHRIHNLRAQIKSNSVTSNNVQSEHE